ncbi:diglucosylglycerate octanoyltransferase [Pseudonocardia nantongensis]|uniref:diglucosylglycerate octanoyltransferase n=1 Tax=Pseudonocardia nantongensis TaxID=1181885 RepID=UPI00397DC8FE
MPDLLVLADSLAFHGPDRPYPADEPRLWPNVAAARFGGDVELVARAGWTARHVWSALTGDPRVWAALPRAGAVVLGVSGMDSLPSPLPTALRELIPALRPEPVRRAVREGYRRAQPVLAPALARLPGGGPVTLPPRLTAAYLERCRAAIHALRPELPVVALLPSVHRAADYGLAHPHRAGTEHAVRAWAETAAVPVLDVAELVGDHVLSGQGNPDGLHWGWAGHRLVGNALADLLEPGTAVPGGHA